MARDNLPPVDPTEQAFERKGVNTAMGFLRNFSKSYAEAYDDEDEKKVVGKSIAGKMGTGGRLVVASLAKKNEAMRKFYDFSLRQAKKMANMPSGKSKGESDKEKRKRDKEKEDKESRFSTLLSFLGKKFGMLKGLFGGKSLSNPFLSPLALKMLVGAIGLGSALKGINAFTKHMGENNSKLDNVTDKLGHIHGALEKVVKFSEKHSKAMAIATAVLSTGLGRWATGKAIKYGAKAVYHGALKPTAKVGKWGAKKIWGKSKQLFADKVAGNVPGVLSKSKGALKSFGSVIGKSGVGRLAGGIMGKAAESGAMQVFKSVAIRALPMVAGELFAGPAGWGMLIAQGAKLIWDYVLPTKWKDEIKYQVAKAYLATIEGVKKAWQEFKSWCDNLMTQVSDWGRAKVEELKQVWDTSVSFVKDLITGQGEAREKLANYFLGLWDSTKETIGNAVGSMASGISNILHSMFADFYDSQGNISISQGVSAWAGKAGNWISNTASALNPVNAFNNSVNWATNTVNAHDGNMGNISSVSASNTGMATANSPSIAGQSARSIDSGMASGRFNNTSRVISGGSPKATRAAQIARSRAQPRSISKCARFVCEALQQAGYKIPKADAKDCPPNLINAGFREVPDTGSYATGDVVVYHANRSHIWGHIAIFDGKNWISDFVQRSIVVHKSNVPPRSIFRDMGGATGNATQISDYANAGNNGRAGSTSRNMSSNSGNSGSTGGGYISNKPSRGLSLVTGGAFGRESSAPSLTSSMNSFLGKTPTSGVKVSKDLGGNQAKAYKAARANGLSDTAARALVANMSGESLTDPSNAHMDKHTDGRNAGIAQGIVQWNPARSEAIKRQFGKYPKDMSVEEQVTAALWEMKTNKMYSASWQALNSGGSAESMVDTLVRNYERPGQPGVAVKQRVGFLHSLNVGDGSSGSEPTTPSGSYAGGGGDFGGGGAGGSFGDSQPTSIFDSRDEQKAPGLVGLFKKMGDYIGMKNDSIFGTTKQDEIKAEPLSLTDTKTTKTKDSKTKTTTTTKTGGVSSIVGLPNIAEPYQENMYTVGVHG